MKPTFLVVDDDEHMRKIIAGMLESFGCEIRSVASGAEALEILGSPESAKEIDGVLLDIMMPGVSGFDVLQKVRAQPHTESLPIIMLTALDTSSSFLGGYQQGANYYITKPFTAAQLVYGLDMVMGEQSPDGEVYSGKTVEIPEDW